MGCCADCRYNYVEIFKGLTCRYYCNNSYSEYYWGELPVTGGCAKWEEIPPRGIAARNKGEIDVKKIAEYYGYEVQSNQLIEECAELIQAVNKYARAEKGKGQPLSEDKRKAAIENLKEEIADVEIMLEQIKYLLAISKQELEAIKRYKVNRTKEIIQRK